MADLAKTQDLEGLARIIDPPAWLEHDDLIKRAEGWERANRDRPDEDFVRRAQGRRADAAELVRMSLSKTEKAWVWVAGRLVGPAITARALQTHLSYLTPDEAGIFLEKVKAHGGGHV